MRQTEEALGQVALETSGRLTRDRTCGHLHTPLLRHVAYPHYLHILTIASNFEQHLDLSLSNAATEWTLQMYHRIILAMKVEQKGVSNEAGTLPLL